MKALITAFILLVTLNTYGQKEIKLPELDTKKNTYTLNFSPDLKDERIISSYMKGTTEKDSLRFWAEGTIFTQKVMVTVFSKDRNVKIKVDIVKDHWEDSKISGYTKDGVFQESFDTAKKFGIVLTCDTPNTPFYLAVWTSGEQTPKMTNLYYAMSDHSQQSGGQITNASFENDSSGNVGQKDSILLYVIIGALAVIAFLLAFMVFKKKKSNTLTILIFLFLGQQIVFAGAEEFSSPAFGGVGIKYPGAMDVINFAIKLPEMSRNARRYLDDEFDLEGEAQVDDAGGPRLPSSCLPSGYGQDDGNDGVDGIDGIDGRDGRDGRDGVGGNNDGVDGNNDGGEFKPFERDKDKPGTGTKPSSENEKDKPLKNNTKDKLKYDDKGRPKYDKDDKWIYYDNSKYPKYDKNGQPIDHGTINENTNFDYKGRPKNNKKGTPIEYDESKYPKYDKNGNPINYNNDDKKRFSAKELQTTLALSSQQIKNLNSIDVVVEIEKNSERVFATAGLLGFINSSPASNDRQKEGCDCLKKAYKDLNKRRLNLEKLRIIYSHAMKKINAGIAFGDGVSAVHGVSALIWQKQKFIILKESIPTLNKAYDDKYAEMIEALEENLREIERCEALLGYKNWYNHAGFIYYAFMADKYKRN